MKGSTLLREVESLSHSNRIKRLVQLGATPLAQRKAVIDELISGSVYHRRLAAFSGFGSRDEGLAALLARDPSRFVSKVAARLVALFGSDELLASLLLELPAARTRRLLVLWRTAKRSAAVIDAHIVQLLAAGSEQQAYAALPYASDALVAELLPKCLSSGHWADASAWIRLARRQPKLIATELRRRADVQTEASATLTSQVVMALPMLVAREPDEAVELVRTMARTTPIANLCLQSLINARPRAFVELMLQADDAPRLGWAEQQAACRALRKVPADMIVKLLESRRSVIDRWPQVVANLTVQQRTALAPIMVKLLVSSDGNLQPRLVQLLPGSLRISEATRHIAMPAIAGEPTALLRYVPFLPWADVCVKAEEWLKHPTPAVRESAVAAVVGAVSYNRDKQKEVLDVVVARRNEQDPVRQAMLRELAEAPPSLWRAESLPALGAVIQHALDAADVSCSSYECLEEFVVRQLAFHTEWAASWLAKIATTRGTVELPAFEDSVPPDAAASAIDALLPVLRVWMSQAREDEVLSALRSFGRRLTLQVGAVDLAEHLAQEALSQSVASEALRLLRKHAWSRFETLVVRLLQKDGTWTQVDTVLQYLNDRRQDLLTPYLGQTAYAGRFSKGKTIAVLPITRGFERWTLAQQQTFTRVLSTLLSTGENRDHQALFQAVSQLSEMPSPVAIAGSTHQAPGGVAEDDEPLRVLAATAAKDVEKVALRDQAIKRLGRLDCARGVPTLLECLRDERARVAIYALRSALSEMGTSNALSVLLNVSSKSVTVSKEVVRLIGDLPGDAPYRTLLAKSKEKLHRDVRVALLRALWNNLAREETWPVLLEAARSGDAGLSAGLVRLPGKALTGKAQESYLDLLEALLNHASPKVRCETLENSPTISDPDRRLLRVLLERIGSTLSREATGAARAVFQSYGAQDAAVIGTAVRAMLTNRRALEKIVSAFHELTRVSRAKALSFAEVILPVLSTLR